MLRTAKNPGGAGAKKQPRGRPFAKGVSGNPGGRPKGLTEFRLKMRAHSEEARRRLLGIIRATKPEAMASAKVRAIRELFDRAWGRPPQELQVQGVMGNVSLDDVSAENRVEIARRLAFMFAEAGHHASREEKPTPRAVRKKVKLEERERG